MPEQGNRVVVPVEKVPPHVRRAVLAAEDRSFYSNPGFDLTGIVRAAWNQLRGGVGGGSTITQQYVKNTLVGDEATLWRKYREMVVAVKISQQRSKDEILGDYLNAIYFGRGAYGIQSAAHAYFGKPVSALTPAEGALLAGLIQSPSRWDPALNPEKAEQRWNFVLDGMVAQGWLSRAERDAAMFPPTIPRRPSTGGVPTDARGHIVTAVRTELEDLGITDQELSQAGLRITTTVDPARQQAAIDAAHAGLAGQPVNLRSAMVAVDPATGGILAYYGGDNGTGLDYARVRRLAGSTFKPFVVLAGLRESPPIGIGETFDGAARPGSAQRRGGRVRAVRPQAGHDRVEQRGLQRHRPAGGAAEGGRRGPRGRHHVAARRPERGHRAGQQGGQHARAGLGVRHRSRAAGCGTRRTWSRRSSPPTAGCCTGRDRTASSASPSRSRAT